jgi:hypothetical protein
MRPRLFHDVLVVGLRLSTIVSLLTTGIGDLAFSQPSVPSTRPNVCQPLFIQKAIVEKLRYTHNVMDARQSATLFLATDRESVLMRTQKSGNTLTDFFPLIQKGLLLLGALPALASPHSNSAASLRYSQVPSILRAAPSARQPPSNAVKRSASVSQTSTIVDNWINNPGDQTLSALRNARKKNTDVVDDVIINRFDSMTPEAQGHLAQGLANLDPELLYAIFSPHLKSADAATQIAAFIILSEYAPDQFSITTASRWVLVLPHGNRATFLKALANNSKARDNILSLAHKGLATNNIDQAISVLRMLDVLDPPEFYTDLVQLWEKSSGDLNLRVETADLLLKRGHFEQALADLNHPDTEIRGAVASRLAVYGDLRCLRPLFAAAADPAQRLLRR